MSQTVDSKVVEMSFDNRQFEQNVGTSLSTLDKLKQALKFDGVAKGMEEVNNATKGVQMGGLGTAVETVQAKFSAMEVVAMTALSNITNSAVNAGKQLIKSFTVDPVNDGFKEYELKMDSVQTIMAGTGASVDKVNEYLNELNTYSDKTIYSFKDMTASIGKFTNAGVELPKAVAAIKGISNEAARSGANAQEASRAMYNFSQALSTGSVKLIDWKSIENANMATKEFKQQLIDTAVALGTVVKDGDNYVTTTTNLQGKVSGAFNAINDFNGSLAHQWLTADVLTQTLSNYAQNVEEMNETEKKAYHDQLMGIYQDETKVKEIMKLGAESSKAATEVKTFTMMMDSLKEAAGSGWAQTFELLFGNLDEAKELWTSVNNVISGFIDASSDARNNLLGGWRDIEEGGRDTLINALADAFKGLLSVITPIKDAFTEMFPPMTAKNLANFVNNFAKFTKRMKLGDTEMLNLKNTFRGLFAILSLFPKVFGLITKAIFPAQTATGGLLSVILKVTGAIGNVIANTIQWIEDSEILEGIISGIASVAVPVFEAIKNAVTNAYKSVSEFVKANVSLPDFSQFNSIGDVFGYIWEQIKNLVDNLPSIEGVGSTIKGVFDKIMGSFGSSSEAGAEAVGGIGSMFTTFLGDSEDLKSKAMTATAAFAEGVMQGLATLDIEKILSAAKVGLLGYIVLQIAGILRNVRVLIGGFKSAAENVKKIPKQITGILDKVKGTIVSYQNDIRANILLKVAIAIGILTASIIALTFVDSQKLANVAVDLALVIGVLAILAAVIGKIVNGMGDKDENPLVSVLDKFLTGIKKAAKKAMSIVSKAAAFTLIAAAVAILAGTLIRLAKLKDDLGGAVVAVGLMIAVGVGLVVLTKHLKKAGRKLQVQQGAAILLIAMSIAKLAKTMIMLSGLSWDQLKVGVVALGAIMAEFGILSKFLANNDVKKAGVGLGIITLAILALVPVIVLFGSMDETAMKGVIVVGIMGAVLSGIVALAGLIGDKLGDKIMKGVLPMLALAGVIAILAPAIALLGAIAPVAEKGLLIIAGALAVLVAFGAVSGIPVVAAGLAALSKTLLSFGASMLMAGAGCVLFAAGLKGLIAVVSIVVVSIMAIAEGAKGLANKIPELAADIGNGIINIGKFIIDLIVAMGPVILQKIEAFFAMLPGWLVTEFPKIVAGIVALGIRIVVTIGNMFVAFTAAIQGAMSGLIQGIVQGIGGAVGPIGNAIKGIFFAFINMVVEGLADFISGIPGIGEGIASEMRAWRDGLKEDLGIDQGKEITGNLTEGMKQGATEGAAGVKDALTSQVDEAMKKVDEKMSKGDEYGKKFMHAQAKGITENKEEVKTAADSNIQALVDQMNTSSESASPDIVGNLFGNIGTDISSMTPEMTGDIQGMLEGSFGGAVEGVDFGSMLQGSGGDIVSGLTGGVEGNMGDFSSVMENLGTDGVEGFDSILQIASPSKAMSQKGTYIVSGLVQGVNQGAPKVQQAFRQMATKAITVIMQNLPKFRLVGTQSGNQYASGVKTAASRASAAGRSLSKAVKDGADGVSMYSIGADMAQGFVNGLISKRGNIRAEGKKHVSIYKDEVKSAGGIHSPSRVMRKVGAFMGEGFILGLNDKVAGISKAGDDAAKAAIRATETPLKHISSLLDSGIDADPIIRPVLDLSDIERNAGRINSLMPTSSLGLSFGAAAAVPGATFKMTNADVVNAVNGLRDELHNTPRGDVYNVGDVTYDDGTNIATAVGSLIRAARTERRI